MFYEADKDRGYSLALGLNEQVVFRFCLASECWVLHLFLASIINFLKFEFSGLLKHSYVKSVINSVQPKLIYYVTDNDKPFWKLKADFPDIIFVLIQNGIHGLLTISHQHETNTQMFKDFTFKAGTKIFTKYYNIDNPENFIPYQNLYDINQPIKIPSH